MSARVETRDARCLAARHVHRVYGLSVRSPWPLACGGDPDAAGADVELSAEAAPLLDRTRSLRRHGVADWFGYERLPDGSDFLRWTGLFEFIVAPDGRRIRCAAADEGAAEVLQTYLLGQVLSFALLKRGVEPLHCTAVLIDGAAVGFLGDCGSGKSTLAAAFLGAGAPLLTDDLLVAQVTSAGVLGHAGPRRIKLFPHVARRLLPGAPGVPMNRGTRKLIIPLPVPSPGRRDGPVPLRALYVLGASRCQRPRRVVIRPLSPRRAALALVRNTFNTVVDEPARLARQLDFAARLALALPMRSLTFPSGLGRLSAVCAAIRADLGAFGA